MPGQLGLGPVAEAVYRAMLARPDDSVKEMADRLGLPDADVRAALDSLTQLTLVRSSPDTSLGARAVSPPLGMQILLSSQEAEVAAQQQRLEKTRIAAAQLIADYAHVQSAIPGLELQYVEGVQAIRDYLELFNSEVQEEFLTFAPGGPQTVENMEASKPLNLQLLGRGVRMRTIYVDSIRRDGPTLAHANWLQEQGASVRTVPALPNRMILIDQRMALVAADANDTSAGAYIVSGPGLLAMLSTLFDYIWQEATPLSEPPPPAPSGLPRAQEEAMRLMAQGRTDESIARSLGVSVRTARRLTNGVITSLDARNRFQAGVHAVQRGYLA
ncbi:helix-turn-helix transcriptional regulator [Streptomyces apocyni]|uniref:helix-turn-helix transcriptional regulator n=1 Tax=Streptomyces apocyni TaxID=2654677 RepID=UPI0012E9F421|nr:helix-turn-helix transcriptional regulator [Streptomyces apocyni]